MKLFLIGVLIGFMLGTAVSSRYMPDWIFALFMVLSALALSQLLRQLWTIWFVKPEEG